MKSSPPIAPETKALHWSVVCLCAAWCGVCKSYESDFRALATRFPGVDFHWVDVEDQADAMGDVDVETFPTLLIAQGPQVHYFGAMLPQIEVLARQIQLFQASEEAKPQSAAVSEGGDLWASLQEVLPQGL